MHLDLTRDLIKPPLEINLFEIAESVITILRSKAKEITVENNIPKNIQMFGHQVGFSQILMNLITNAVDAVKPGEGKILINAKIEDENKIVLIVSDNGMGISNQILQRIFDPFFTTKEVGKGTGLGMHIVKTEVERHYGKIEVSSTVNVGTTFTLHFPMNLETLIQQAA